MPYHEFFVILYLRLNSRAVFDKSQATQAQHQSYVLYNRDI